MKLTQRKISNFYAQCLSCPACWMWLLMRTHILFQNIRIQIQIEPPKALIILSSVSSLRLRQGPCTGNQQSLAHSRLWDAVVGFLHVFAHMMMKLAQVRDIRNTYIDFIFLPLLSIYFPLLNSRDPFCRESRTFLISNVLLKLNKRSKLF